MDIECYRLLVKVAETGNLTKAAASIGYSQSAASHIIKNVEKHLGLKLLSRDNSGTKLTMEGSMLLPYIRDTVSSENRMFDAVSSILGISKGVLKVGAFSSVCLALLPKVIRDFSSRYPGIMIEIVQSLGHYQEMEDFLFDGIADCSFVRLPVAKGLNVIKLLDDPYMVVLPPDHPLARQKEISLQQLQDVPFLMPAQSNNDDILMFSQEYNFIPNTVMTLHDDLALLKMAENNLGCTILTDLVLRSCPHKAVTRPISGHPVRTIGLATRADITASPLLAAFIEVVKDHVL